MRSFGLYQGMESRVVRGRGPQLVDGLGQDGAPDECGCSGDIGQPDTEKG